MERTKQQALENPMPGDRWELGEGIWKVNMTSGNPIHSIWMTVFSAGNPNSVRDDDRSIHRFRCLAANATYLGNETEVGSEPGTAAARGEE